MSIEQTMVLVVNQSVETLSVIRSVLEESGFRTLVANRHELDGEDLLVFIENHRPDVVVYDVPWPYDERLAEFVRLRADPVRKPRCGWMVLTTSSVVRDKLTAEGVPVIMKPFDFDELMQTVGALVTAEPV